MGAEGLMHNRLHHQAGKDYAVGIAADDGFRHDLLDDDDHPLGGEGGLFLNPQQTPGLGIAVCVGALRMDERQIGIQRRYDGDALGRVGALDKHDPRVSAEDFKRIWCLQ